MEKAIIDAISAVGFPIVACIILGIFINGRIKRQDGRMDKMEVEHKSDKENFFKELALLHEENKEDKKMFSSAVDSFNDSVKEFKATNREMIAIKDDVKDAKNDIMEIRNIIEFKIEKIP